MMTVTAKKMATSMVHAVSSESIIMSDSGDHSIQEGDKVILKKENNIQIAQVLKSKKVNMDKQWFNLYGAIGHPYGTSFVAEGNTIHPAVQETEIHNVKEEESEVRKDNRNIRDTSDSQKLSREEIEGLRAQGEKGEEVIRQLIENSSSFNDKTEYSKAKYIKKKAKKHINKFTIVRPCTRLIAEMYFNKGAARINHLRMDALAQMLTFGDVKGNNRQLVVESCNGLLLAATMERMGGHGTIVQLHAEQDPPRQVLEGYNFSPDHYKMLHHFPLRFMGTVCQTVTLPKDDQEEGTQAKRVKLDESPTDKEKNGDDVLVESEENGSTKDTKSSAVEDKDVKDQGQRRLEEALEAEENTLDAAEETTRPHKPHATKLDDAGKQAVKAEQERRKQLRLRKIEATRHILQEGKFDSLLVATRVHPTPIVLRLLDLLADSRPVVVFSPYQEPLIDCYQRLRDSGKVVHLRLSETWLRNYQVLPNRTHPEINMSMNGGFLLTFIKVSDNQAPPFTV